MKHLKISWAIASKCSGTVLDKFTDNEVYYFFVTEGIMPNRSGQGTLVEFVRYVVDSYFEESQAWEKIIEKATISVQWWSGLGAVQRRKWRFPPEADLV